ncbi:hypothetical protein CJJ23_03025 [Mycoplasmopsis agassizii]|uniref:Uncharacterized protein n=1 Tax=Mycoplasmopsis agassizii TaxID=33922 RepID=A0A269TIB1_9BACT|nr:hypothetical protein [Mycoplasmopsis agassizii]PAK21223.1 hypothetical protein CJJ23_03025 [Mycoplasmopsis agassizii]
MVITYIKPTKKNFKTRLNKLEKRVKQIDIWLSDFSPAVDRLSQSFGSLVQAVNKLQIATKNLVEAINNANTVLEQILFKFYSYCRCSSLKWMLRNKWN